MVTTLLTSFAATCNDSSFFGLPKWYKYLKTIEPDLGKGFGGGKTCVAQINNINDIWLILLAVIEMLLRVGALVAFVFIIIGGVHYISSQGEPEKLKKALGTVINAAIGLAICLSAVVIINFLAGKF
jgi:hypothetical protein